MIQEILRKILSEEFGTHCVRWDSKYISIVVETTEFSERRSLRRNILFTITKVCGDCDPNKCDGDQCHNYSVKGRWVVDITGLLPLQSIYNFPDEDWSNPNVDPKVHIDGIIKAIREYVRES